MRALLDVNVLIALLDSSHAQHATALDWYGAHMKSGWASCPLTQNGCIRILSQSSYLGRLPAVEVAQRLGKATATAHHMFWPDDVSLLDKDVVNWDRLLSPRQITDSYLLALAVRHGGRFVTLDRGISLASVCGAQARHVVML